MPDDELFALPLEEFIAGRDKLAKELRKSDKEAAAVLAKLPKPTPAAWAANQVAREEPDLIATLLDAGAALRAAQDAALAGGGAENLRTATQAERRAVDDVMRVAVKLKPAGKPLSRAMADRLRTTLHAAAGDPELRAALSAGRLVGEAQAGGTWPFALETTDLPAPPPKKKPAAKQKTGEGRGRRGRARGRGTRGAGTARARGRAARGARHAEGPRARRQGRRGGRAGRRPKRSTPRRPRSIRPARPWRTRRPRRSQRSGCSRAPARSATRPATPSRGSKNAWIDGAPPLGSSRRWLN